MLQPFTFLKCQLLLKDGSLTQAARRLEWDYNRLSRIINRRVEPTDDERRRLAWYLQKSATQLFENNGC
jgi:hypothetical protein